MEIGILSTIGESLVSEIRDTRDKLSSILEKYRVNLYERRFTITDGQLIVGGLGRYKDGDNGWLLLKTNDHLGNNYEYLKHNIYRIPVSDFGSYEESKHLMRIYRNGLLLQRSDYIVENQQGGFILYIAAEKVVVNDTILVSIDRIHTTENMLSYHYLSSSNIVREGRDLIYKVPIGDIGSFIRDLSDIILYEHNIDKSVSSTNNGFLPLNVDYELRPVYSVDNKLTDVAIVFTEKSDALLEKIKNNNVIVINNNYFISTRLEVTEELKELGMYSVDVTEDSNRVIPIISVASGDLDIYIDGLHQTENIDYVIRRHIVGNRFLGNVVSFVDSVKTGSIINIFKTTLPTTIITNPYIKNDSSPEDITQVSSQISIDDLRSYKSSNNLFRKGLFLLDDSDLPIPRKSIRFYSNGLRYSNNDLETYEDSPVDRIVYEYVGEDKLSPINLDIKAHFCFPIVDNTFLRSTFVDFFHTPDEKVVRVFEDLILYYRDMIARVREIKIPEELMFLRKNELPVITAPVIKDMIERKDPSLTDSNFYKAADGLNYCGFDPILPLLPIPETKFKTIPTTGETTNPLMWDENFRNVLVENTDPFRTAITFAANRQNLIRPSDLSMTTFSTDNGYLRISLEFCTEELFESYFLKIQSHNYLYLQHESSFYRPEEISKFLINNIEKLEESKTLLIDLEVITVENFDLDDLRYLIYTDFQLTENDDFIIVHTAKIEHITEVEWKSLRKGEKLLIKKLTIEENDVRERLLSFIKYDSKKKEAMFYCSDLNYKDIFQFIFGGFAILRGSKPWFPKRNFPSGYTNPFFKNYIHPLTKVSLSHPLPCYKDEKYLKFGNENDQLYKYLNDSVDYMINKVLVFLSKSSVSYFQERESRRYNESLEHTRYLESEEWKNFLNTPSVKRFLSSPAYLDYYNTQYILDRNNYVATDPFYSIYSRYLSYFRSDKAKEWENITSSVFFKNSYFCRKNKQVMQEIYDYIIEDPNVGGDIRAANDALVEFIDCFTNGLYGTDYLNKIEGMGEDYRFDRDLSSSMKVEMDNVFKVRDKGFHDRLIRLLRPYLNINSDTIIDNEALIQFFSTIISSNNIEKVLDFSESCIDTVDDLALLDFSKVSSDMGYVLNLSKNNITEIGRETLPAIAPSTVANGNSLQFSLVRQVIDLSDNPLSPRSQIYLMQEFIEKGKDVRFKDTVSVFNEPKLHIAANIQNSGSKDPLFLNKHRYLKPAFKEYDSENLDGIRRIKLANSGIVDITGIDSCKNLEELLLRDNLIFEIPLDASWSYLTKLKILDLGRNYRLSNSTFIRNCYYLEELYLDDTLVSEISFCEEFKNLQILNIGNTMVSDFSHIGNGLEFLEYINLNNTQTDNISYLFSLANLKYLSASNILLDPDFLPANVGGNKNYNMEFLDLSNNGLNSQILAVVYRFENLKKLYLKGNNFDIFSIFSLNITDLDISNSNITELVTDFGEDELETAKISTIDISNNPIADHVATFEVLATLPMLKYVGLRNIGLTTINQKTFTRYFNPLQKIDLRENPLDRPSQVYLDHLNQKGNFNIIFRGSKVYSIDKNTLIESVEEV